MNNAEIAALALDTEPMRPVGWLLMDRENNVVTGIIMTEPPAELVSTYDTLAREHAPHRVVRVWVFN